MNDVLTVSYDGSEDRGCLGLLKNVGQSRYGVGEFKDDEADRIYKLLNQGNPFLKNSLSGE